MVRFAISRWACCFCLACSASVASAATAHYRLVAGHSDFNFSFQPTNPTTADLLVFYDPTGIGNNSCQATLAFGKPIPPAADFFNSHLIVGVLAPADPGTSCSQEINPVRGIEGTFGPLSAGDYIFRDYGGIDHPFTVGAVPEPTTLSMLGAILVLGKRRRAAIEDRRA